MTYIHLKHLPYKTKLQFMVRVIELLKVDIVVENMIINSKDNGLTLQYNCACVRTLIQLCTFIL